MMLRPVTLSYFSDASSDPEVICGQNFGVQRFSGASSGSFSIFSDDEILFVFPETAGTLSNKYGVWEIAPRAFAIAPPGRIELSVFAPGRAYALTTGLPDSVLSSSINSTAYAERDPLVKPVGTKPPSSVGQSGGVRVYQVDDIPYPTGNSRIKFLQTANLSVNWVEYDGPRDRRLLSPHAHEDFEQGSLAISGDYIHHIRTPWGRDATAWGEDQHLKASNDSLLIIPPELIHTTEGIGDQHHVLMDVFAPPRADFVANGWVHNADEYR